MELRAERGRVVLVGAPELFEPPTALAGALDEWAEVAAAVCANDHTDPATAELVSARGRQLAARLAAAAGTSVRYADPVRGVRERVPAAEPTAVTSRRPPRAVAEPTPRAVAEPTLRAVAEPTLRAAAEPTAVAPGRPPRDAAEPTPWATGLTPPPRDAAEPTPWATGLAVSAFAAAVVLAAVVTLVRGLGEVAWWLGAFGLVVVTAGLAPSVWLARHTPLWRWISYGVAGGLALSWIAVLLSTLGP